MKLPKNVPHVLKEAHESWTDLNSDDYVVKHYGGDDCRNFIRKNMGERVLRAFDKVKPYSYKCDLARYCLIYIEGGVYMDWKMVTHLPIDDNLITDQTEWFGAWGCELTELTTGLFAARKGHPVLREAIEMCVRNIEDEYYGHCSIAPTGPWLFFRAFKSYYNKQFKPHEYVQTDKVTIGKYMYPYISFDQDVVYFTIKHPECTQDQTWDEGNNYNVMYANRDVYTV